MHPPQNTLPSLCPPKPPLFLSYSFPCLPLPQSGERSLSSAAGRTPSSVSVKWKKKKKKRPASWKSQCEPGAAVHNARRWLAAAGARQSRRPKQWQGGVGAGAGGRGGGTLGPSPLLSPQPLTPTPFIYIYMYMYFFFSQVLLPRYPPLNPKAPRDWVLGPGTSVGL